MDDGNDNLGDTRTTMGAETNTAGSSMRALPVITANTTRTVRNDSTADRNLISDKELSECDREKLHLIGHVQGGSGHVLFISYPEGKILAGDANAASVPWIRERKDLNHKRANEELQQEAGGTSSTAAIPASEGTGVATSAASGAASLQDENSTQNDQQVIESSAVDEMIGSPLQKWLPASLYQDIVDSIESMKKARSNRTFLFYEYREDAYAISLSTTNRVCSNICVEIEDIENAEAEGEFYNTLVSLGRVMEFYADDRVIKNACDTVFNLLENYDRGMVYRFRDDKSGEVIHEIKKSHITSSYLGMRFPASDIPLPARQLYIKNGLRYIENIEADAVPIISHSPVDLSHCRMRAVAKPHIVYLRNMGITCSLSIAIVVEGDLWCQSSSHSLNYLS